MKEFLKYTLATIAGIVIFGIITTILMLMSIVGMVASNSQTTTIDDNSVLVIKLDGNITDHADDGSPLAALKGEVETQLSLDNLTDAIERAKENEDVKGIYIEAGNISAEPATLQALRDQLKDFKKSKKFVVAYGNVYSQGAYYVASVADKVWINPIGQIEWHGMSSTSEFYRDAMAKFGVKFQVVKVGKYKGATEVYTEDHLSDANREQITAYVGGIWNRILKDVSESRKVSVDSLNSYADRVMDFDDTEELKNKKLIDGVLYTDQVKDEVKKLLKMDLKDDISQVSVQQMLQTKSEVSSSDNAIAVYYCEGEIIDEPLTGLFSGNVQSIVGKDVCKDLEKLIYDDNIKAVVIRVNSPGGSAFASEQIWHEIQMLKKAKPVVISMGGMAASGGYYMSCGATWIVSEPTTLTGSIGIFAALPDFSGLLTDKIGVKFDQVNTNKNSGMTTAGSVRSFTPEELALLQKYVDRGYQLFRQRVADGRHMKVDEVEKIAQGHVWIGKDAIALHLVDQMGSLKDAVDMAGKFAKLEKDDYRIEKYPAPADWTETLMNDVANDDNYLSVRLQETLGEYYKPFMIMKNAREQNPVQAIMTTGCRL